MEYRNSIAMKIHLKPGQDTMLSSQTRIQQALKEGEGVGIDIIHQDQLIGFAMVREFKPKHFFLWNYAIDANYQGRGWGKQALLGLIDWLHDYKQLQVMTTTYTEGNELARKLYEGVGFIETDRVIEEDCREVNMRLTLNP